MENPTGPTEIITNKRGNYDVRLWNHNRDAWITIACNVSLGEAIGVGVHADEYIATWTVAAMEELGAALTAEVKATRLELERTLRSIR